MLVKQYLPLLVLTTVMWSTLGAVISKSARSISSAHGRSLVKRLAKSPNYRRPRRSFPGRTPTITTPPTTEPPPTPANGSCFYEDNYYQDGEYIYWSPCTFTKCSGGAVMIGDTFCDNENCNAVYEGNDCCPPCPTPTSTSVPGCYENGRWYQYWEYITNEPCYQSMCTENGILYGDTFCNNHEGKCNLSSPPNECCPACPTTQSSTETTESTTTPKIVCK